jgi:hypothetical protein
MKTRKVGSNGPEVSVIGLILGSSCELTGSAG